MGDECKHEQKKKSKHKNTTSAKMKQNRSKRRATIVYKVFFLPTGK